MNPGGYTQLAKLVECYFTLSLYYHQELCLILSYPEISKLQYELNSGKRSGCLSVFISHPYKIIFP